MTHPFNAWLDIQKTTLETAASVSNLIMKTNLRLLDQQIALFNHVHGHQRGDEPKGVANFRAQRRSGKRAGSPCRGADLQDHYGKRATDVRVEKI